MIKIDEKLMNFMILGDKACVLEAIVYYGDKEKAKTYFFLNGIKIIKELDFINAFVVCFNSENILNTAAQNFVTYISSVSTVETCVATSKKIMGVNNCFGDGQVIAFIDTGVDCHFDFVLGKNKILFFKDFIKNKQNPYDDNGHGTFVTGVASGSGVSSLGAFSGVAPKSKIISLKALDSKGEANAVTILEAMEWVLDNRKKFDINIVCMSFGSEPLGVNDPIVRGAEVLWEEGIFVVCAAGNSGPNRETIKSPGVSRKIVTVGGINDMRDEIGGYDNKKFLIAEFSSRGPAFGRVKPDVVAPGVNITSCSLGGGYKQMSGTSVATPMVAGIAAIIRQKYPNATPDQIKQFLMKSAIPLDCSKNEQGAGLVNVFSVQQS